MTGTRRTPVADPLSEPLSAEEEAEWRQEFARGLANDRLGWWGERCARLLATLDAARRQSAATLDGWRDAAELRRDAARADALAWAEADDDVVEESQRFVGLRARWWLDGARWALARWRDATGPRARVAAEDRAALTAEAGPR